MALADEIARFRAVENAISDALDQPRAHTVTGAFQYESWSLKSLEEERERLSMRIIRMSGGSHTVSQGGN